jgi:hypothetical protein
MSKNIIFSAKPRPKWDSFNPSNLIPRKTDFTPGESFPAASRMRG